MMTAQDPCAGSDRQHQDLREQLPWYVNQTLSEAERLDVEHHLTSCSDCQAELIEWQQLAAAVQEAEVSIPVPRPEQFAALMDQIDAAEADSQAPRTWWSVLRERLNAVLPTGPLWQSIPSFTRLALAAQAAVIVLLAGLLMWRAQTPSASLYQTLSSDVVSTAPKGRVKLIFAPDTTVQDLQQLLTAAQATVIAGPSPMGVYTVEVILPPDKPEALTSALETFRAHTAIELAEPASSP